MVVRLSVHAAGPGLDIAGHHFNDFEHAHRHAIGCQAAVILLTFMLLPRRNPLSGCLGMAGHSPVSLNGPVSVSTVVLPIHNSQD